MPARSWLAGLRSRFGARARAADELGILSFEAAAVMSRLLSLHRALSDAEVRRLRADAVRAEGVAKLTSPDQSLLLRLACCELVEDLDWAAGVAARFGARCRADAPPLLRDFDRVYADAKRGSLAQLDATFGFSRGAGKRFREMERHVAVAARLYAEMDALGELEASERRMEQWKQHSGPIPAQTEPGKRQPTEPGEKLMRELRAQRHKVQRLTEGSLWSVATCKAAKDMAKSVLAVLARISIVFGASVPGLPPVPVGRTPALAHSSGPLNRAATPGMTLRHSAPIVSQTVAASPVLGSIKPAASSVGGSGMELRYAKIILSAEALLAALRPVPGDGGEVQEGIVDLSRRNGLYKMLPVSIRDTVNAKLRGSSRTGQAMDKDAAAVARESAESKLRWLVPMAHDTVRWHDERSMERAQRFSMLPRALMVQTLHLADRQKADDHIVAVLVALSCVCRYDDERRRLESLEWEDDGE